MIDGSLLHEDISKKKKKISFLDLTGRIAKNLPMIFETYS